MWFLGEDEQSQEKICYYYLRFNCMHDNWLLRGDVHIELYKIWKKCNSIIKKSSTNKEISFTNYTFVSIHWTQFEFSILQFLMSFQSRTCQKRHFYQNFFYLKMVKKILQKFPKALPYYFHFKSTVSATKVYRAVTK